MMSNGDEIEREPQASNFQAACMVYAKDGLFMTNSQPVAEEGDSQKLDVCHSQETAPTMVSNGDESERDPQASNAQTACMVYAKDGLFLTNSPPIAAEGDFQPFEAASDSGHGIGDGNNETYSMAHSTHSCNPYIEVVEDGLYLTDSPPIEEEGAHCLHCKVLEKQVMLPCNHMNTCYICYFCKFFWLQHLAMFQTATCLTCGQPYNDIHDPVLYIMALAFNRRRPRTLPCGCLIRRG